MKSRFKRPLPLAADEEAEFRVRTPPRQHSPVKAEWELDKYEDKKPYSKIKKISYLNTLKNSFRSHETDSKVGTQNIYQAALLLKKDFDSSLKNLKTIKTESIMERPSSFTLIKSEVEKVSKNFDLIFQEIQKQQQQILSLFEIFETN